MKSEDEELSRNGHERLVEVLLEEEFGGERKAAPSRPDRSRWLAAALVMLGLGAVIGTALLRRGEAGAGSESAPASAQQQEPERTEVTPKDGAEYRRLLQDVEGVRLRMVERPGLKTHLEVPPGAAPYVPSAAADPGRSPGHARLSAARIAGFLAALPPLPERILDGSQPGPGFFDLELELELKGQRVLRLGVALDQSAWLHPFPLPVVPLAAGPCLDTLRALRDEAMTNARIARGVAFTFDELARVPATAKEVQCPPLPPGTVAQHLGRFTNLERVDQVLATTLGNGPVSFDVRAPARLAEFAVLPHLRHLRFSGVGLTDLDVADLPRLPSLVSVRIDGGLDQLTDGGRTMLVRKLDAIELISVEHGEAIVRAAIAAGRIRKLALFGVELPDADFAALIVVPSLRELDITGIFWTDAHLTRLAKSTSQLERLRLRSTEVTVPGLRQLGELRTLRELDLRQEGRLDEAHTELPKSLPNCRIRWPGEPRDEDPFAGYSRTRR